MPVWSSGFFWERDDCRGGELLPKERKLSFFFFLVPWGNLLQIRWHYSVLDTEVFQRGGGVRGGGGQQTGMSNLQHADAEVRQEEGRVGIQC